MGNISVSSLFKKNSLITLALIYIPGFLFLGTVLFIARANGIFFETISRDPVQVLNGKPYVGIISNLGILFWSSASAILFYSALIVRNRKRPAKEVYFLVFSGLLSILMLIDDFFLMHDVIFPDYLKINEMVVYLFYGLSAVAIFLRYFRIIMDTDYVLLILAFILLGLSATTDEIIAFGIHIQHPYIVEDSFKFLGILSWFSYFTRTAYKFVKAAIV
jgi:hypothetical protein